MKRIVLLLPALALGCVAQISQPEELLLPGGEPVECLEYVQEACGMAMHQCGTGHALDYACVSGVTYKGKGAPLPVNRAPSAD
jgi:hypothetical protein